MTSSRQVPPPACRKILFICDFNAHGGTQTHLLQLIERLDRTRYRPSLATLNLDPALSSQLKRLDVDVENLALKGAFRPSTFSSMRRLAARVRNEEYSLLHGFLFQGNILAAGISSMSGVPLLTSVRNMGIGKKGWHRKVSAIAHRKALSVVFNSEAVREHTLDSERLDPDRTAVIYNGIEQVTSSPGTSGRDGGPVIVCVASLREKKGHEYLFDALRILHKSSPAARLVLAGDGPSRESLQARADELGLESNIDWLGYRTDMVEVLAAADIFVLASLEEGMPNALLEAMAAGLPAVVTDVGGNKEVLVEGATGFLVPARSPEALADRLMRLIDDPAMRRRMGDAASERMKSRFDLPKMVMAYQDLYDEVLCPGQSS